MADLGEVIKSRISEIRRLSKDAQSAIDWYEAANLALSVLHDTIGDSHPLMAEIQGALIAPRSPWQNAYAERGIGSIRRECLDHLVVIGERHLPPDLSTYADYYNRTRTHLSLTKDSPEPRTGQRPSQGRVVSVPRVGGLHHEYLRRVA